MNDFEKMNKLAAENNKGFKMFPLDNIKRANIGKKEYGELTIAVHRDVLIDIDNYVGGLYLIKKSEWDKLK